MQSAGPALVGFDADISRTCLHARVIRSTSGVTGTPVDCMMANFSILALHSMHVPYNLCRNLEWLSCAAMGRLRRQRYMMLATGVSALTPGVGPLRFGAKSGFAPPHLQDGVGDTYIYKAPGASDGMGNLEHLDMTELGFIWDYINGELACGEYVRKASVNHYLRGLARYRKQRTDDDVLLPEEDVEY